MVRFGARAANGLHAMEQRAIYFWLVKKARSQARRSLLAAGLLFLFGLVVLSLTLGVIYLVIGCTFDWGIPHSISTRLIASLIVLGLLFVGNAITDRAYLESLPSPPEPVRKNR